MEQEGRGGMHMARSLEVCVRRVWRVRRECVWCVVCGVWCVGSVRGAVCVTGQQVEGQLYMRHLWVSQRRDDLLRLVPDTTRGQDSEGRTVRVRR